jgi:glutathione S-transferase
VDAFSDLAADLSTTWSTAHFGDEAAKKVYNEEKLPRFLASVDRYLAQRDGPYILGNEPTYADFKLYATLLDIQPDATKLPHLKAFLAAARARPGVKSHLSTVPGKPQ